MSAGTFRKHLVGLDPLDDQERGPDWVNGMPGLLASQVYYPSSVGSPIAGLGLEGYLPIWARQRLAAASGDAGSSGASGAPGGTTLGEGGNPGVLQYRSQIEEASRLTGVPAEVIAAVMDIESDGAWATSPAGAIGPMQVMAKWHAARAEKYGDSVYSTRGNILAGADYLKELYDQVVKIYGVAGDEAWAITAGAYLNGDPSWKLNGNRSQDAYGTDAYKYSELFKELLPVYRAGLNGYAADAGSGDIGSTIGETPITAVTGGTPWPVTQEYGATDFAQSSNMYQDGFHSGYDIGVDYGTRLTTPWDGVVEFAGDAGDGYGNKVVIRMANGYRVLLGHMSTLGVKAGQRVRAGDRIGLSGNSGASTGPHVHVSILDPNGNYVDPSEFFVF